MATHSFCIEDAEKYGIEEAIILWNIGFWCVRNLANRVNIREGHVWTFNTRESFLELFPYIAPGKEKKARLTKMGRILQSLEKQEAIVSTELNKSNYDRTKWYSIADISKLEKYGHISPEALKTLRDQNCSLEKSELIPQGNKSVLSSPDNKQQIESSSKPADAVFDFDLVFAWILVQFQKSDWYDLDSLDQAFVEAKLEEYQSKYKQPNKGAALSYVDMAMRQRHRIERRSALASVARDNLNRSVVNQLETQATVVDQHTQNMKPRTTHDKLTDRSWADGLDLSEEG